MAKGGKCSDLDLIETGLSPPIFSELKCELCEGRHLWVGQHSREGPEPQIKIKELNQTNIQRSEAPASPTGPQAGAEFFQGNEPLCSGCKLLQQFLVAIWQFLSK